MGRMSTYTMKVLGLLTRFHGTIAMPISVIKIEPLRILINRGISVVKSMPELTLFKTMHRESWLAKSARPAKNVPALMLGNMVSRSWIYSISRNGFQKTCPYSLLVALLIKIPNKAVMQTVTGAANA